MHKRAAGFTLLEILIVLVIVGVVVAMASVNFGESDATKVRHEAERLSVLLEHVSDEAIAGGSTLGFSPSQTGDGYEFWQLDPRGLWQPVQQSETLRPRKLPADMAIRNVMINRTQLRKDDRVRFSPSGVNTPFSLTLSLGAVSRTLTVDAMGRINEGDTIATVSP